MTIGQLKRHMDRRFDRLDRTKADKRELRRFATKVDLRREIRAVRRDMRLWAADIKRHFDVVAEDLRENIQKVAEAVAAIPAVNDRLPHHDTILDDHETRIATVERRL